LKNIGSFINRGLFGGLVVIPAPNTEIFRSFLYLPDLKKVLKIVEALTGHPHHTKHKRKGGNPMKMTMVPPMAAWGMNMPMPGGNPMAASGHGLDLSEIPPSSRTIS
jgi:hypothetical protein